MGTVICIGIIDIGLSVAYAYLAIDRCDKTPAKCFLTIAVAMAFMAGFALAGGQT